MSAQPNPEKVYYVVITDKRGRAAAIYRAESREDAGVAARHARGATKAFLGVTTHRPSAPRKAFYTDPVRFLAAAGAVDDGVVLRNDETRRGEE